MSDLVERLLAAIEQREEIAKAARTTLWDDDADERRPVDGAWEVDYEGSVSEQLTLDSIAGCTRVDFEHTRLREGVAPHIAANDPASVLRLCQAHREIIGKHQPNEINGDTNDGYFGCKVCDAGFESCGCVGSGQWPCETLEDLAGGYGIQEDG